MRTGSPAVKNRSMQTNTFEDEFEYGRPRQGKIREVKEREIVKRPEARARFEGDEDRARKREQTPRGFHFPARSTLYGTFFVLLAVLVILLVINNGNSGSNSVPANSNTVSAKQNNDKPAVAGGNTTTSSSPATPVTTPVDNGTVNAQGSTPSVPKDTAIPKLVGAKPEIMPTDTSVTITWKTDEKSKSTIKYGPNRACDFFSPDEADFKIEHNIYLSNLAADTLYYYRIISTDKANNSGILLEDSFRTDYPSNAAPYVGGKAPDFTLTTLDGNQVSLKQYRGRKVILNFWASWCTPCKVELPHLQEIWEKYKNGSEVTVLTVAGSESVESEIRSYIDSKGYTFPVCLDSTESTFNRYNLTSIPKTYFIDESGTIKKVQLGMFTSPGEIEFMLTSF